MTRTTSRILDSGDPFPPLTAPSVAHGTITLPDALAAGWGIVLLYRGHW
jgi:hypothetical protein